MPEPSLGAVTDRRLLPRFLRGQPGQTVLITMVLVVFGIGLIAQSDRWARTPAYGLLLQITTADVWGLVYLAAAALMTAAIALRTRRIVQLVAHTLTVMLLGMWEFAFIVRYITDSATTVVNVVSWSTYLFLAVWSALLIDRPAVAQ